MTGPASILTEVIVKDPKAKATRSSDRIVGEHLNSPVSDPGYFPYPRLSGGLQETITGLDEPRDPAGLVPPYKGSLKEDDGEF